MNVAIKQRVWTPEQRLVQSRKLRERQIWLKSTGPKTAEGKQASSRNARKAGYIERVEMKKIMRYLRTQKSYIDLLKFYIKQRDNMLTPQHILTNIQLNFFENELIAIEADLRSGCGEIPTNIIPFPEPPP